MELIFPLEGKKNCTSVQENYVLDIPDIDKTHNSAKSLLFCERDNIPDQHALTFQACVTAASRGHRVIMVTAEKPEKIPMSVHGMPSLTSRGHRSECLPNLSLVYPSSRHELLAFLSALGGIRDPTGQPDILVVDSIQAFFTEEDRKSGDEFDTELCRMFAILSDLTNSVSGRKKEFRCLVGLGLDSVHPWMAKFRLWFDEIWTLNGGETGGDLEYVNVWAKTITKMRFSRERKQYYPIALTRK